MKVCDVVLNSIWYDPRVRKQIIEYKNQGVEVNCVGYRCNRFDEEQIKKIPAPVSIVSIDKKYDEMCIRDSVQTVSKLLI